MTLHTLVPLGTNGFFASHSRLTMAFLCLGHDQSRGTKTALLLDAGSGLGRLIEDDVFTLLKGTQHIDVVLTHYHLDHVCGLPALLAILEEVAKRNNDHPPTVSLFVPQPPLVDAAAELALNNLLTPPIFPSTIEAFRHRITVHSYSTGEDLGEIQIGAPIAVRRQTHSGGSVGLRIGDQLAYITDTRASESTIDFVQGVDLLLHEAWVSHTTATENPETVSGHTDLRSLRRIAEQAGVGTLMPVHHHPSHNAQSLQEMHRDLASDSYRLIQSTEGRPVQLAVQLTPTSRQSPSSPGTAELR